MGTVLSWLTPERMSLEYRYFMRDYEEYEKGPKEAGYGNRLLWGSCGAEGDRTLGL
jgi:hypothetical protein